MAHFQATIRVFDVVGQDPPSARRLVEERLRQAGFSRWRVLHVGLQRAVTPAVRPRRRPIRTDASYAGGGLLLAAVFAWALWFLWLLNS